VTRYNVHLPSHQIAALRKIAEEKGMTVAELIRRAIDEWLAKNAKTGKE
jgi:predicted DNA binding CopG/RHH family protein